MKAETRVTYWKKYRADLEKTDVETIDSQGYKPLHLFTTIKEETVILEKNIYEIEKNHKDFDLLIKKHNNKVLAFKLILSSVLVIGGFIFAYFAFFYTF